MLERLKEFRKQYELSSLDQLWLMIDTDRWPEEALSDVARQAKEQQFRLAISNPCFEIWLWCHFQPLPDGTVTCRQVKQNLRTFLGGYNSSHFDPQPFLERVAHACQEARKRPVPAGERWPHQVGTQVYLVMEEILQWLAPHPAATGQGAERTTTPAGSGPGLPGPGRRSR
ncbi:MAG: RloB domain-containing protein [Magnetococcales bacterium]|nr:RloB domain-containing protein [Magnetococcales bacterium]